MHPPTPVFDGIMGEAQLLHGQSEYARAAMFYEGASYLTPDTSEQGRAIRGQAVSTYRSGEITGDEATQEAARTLARDAYWLHDQQLEATATVATLREHIESARVLGRMNLHRALWSERRTGEIALHGIEAAKNILRTAAASSIRLRARLGRGAPPDQHEINIAPDMAMSEIFTAERGENKRDIKYLLRRARALAWESESPALPTRANLGWRYRAKAVGKSVYRAYAASAANLFATPQASLRRKVAVRIATLPGVL